MGWQAFSIHLKIQRHKWIITEVIIMTLKFLLAALTLTALPFAHAGEPSLYFIEPANGATVSSPVTVKFGLKNFGVAPAGVANENTGHHHLLIDTPLPDLTQPIASDANHIHFGGGQTETELTLAPGKHTLQLLLGNGMHIPHAKPLHSEVITITVK
jgi:hypothetical protein